MSAKLHLGSMYCQDSPNQATIMMNSLINATPICVSSELSVASGEVEFSTAIENVVVGIFPEGVPINSTMSPSERPTLPKLSSSYN